MHLHSESPLQSTHQTQLHIECAQTVNSRSSWHQMQHAKPSTFYTERTHIAHIHIRMRCECIRRRPHTNIKMHVRVRVRVRVCDAASLFRCFPNVILTQEREQNEWTNWKTIEGTRCMAQTKYNSSQQRNGETTTTKSMWKAEKKRKITYIYILEFQSRNTQSQNAFALHTMNENAQRLAHNAAAVVVVVSALPYCNVKQTRESSNRFGWETHNYYSAIELFDYFILRMHDLALAFPWCNVEMCIYFGIFAFAIHRHFIEIFQLNCDALNYLMQNRKLDSAFGTAYSFHIPVLLSSMVNTRAIWCSGWIGSRRFGIVSALVREDILPALQWIAQINNKGLGYSMFIQLMAIAFSSIGVPRRQNIENITEKIGRDEQFQFQFHFCLFYSKSCPVRWFLFSTFGCCCFDDKADDNDGLLNACSFT